MGLVCDVQDIGQDGGQGGGHGDQQGCGSRQGVLIFVFFAGFVFDVRGGFILVLLGGGIRDSLEVGDWDSLGG